MKNVEEKREQTVIKSNHLIQQSRQQLSLSEQKAILYVCSMIKPTDKELEYEFSITDYLKVCGISDGGKNYEDLKQTLKNLTTKKWELRNEETGDWYWVSWLGELSGNDKESVFKVGIQKALKPYLLDITKNYTRYELINILALTSSYAVQLYEILKSYAWTGRWVVTVDDFKAKLGLDKLKSYEAWGNVKNRVIEVAVRQISEKTDLSVDCRDNGSRGRKATQIAFIIETKTDREYEATKDSVNQILNCNGSLDDDEIDISLKNWLAENTPAPAPKKDKADGQAAPKKYNIQKSRRVAPVGNRDLNKVLGIK